MSDKRKTPLIQSFDEARNDGEKLSMIYMAVQHVDNRVSSIERALNGENRAEDGMVVRVDRLERDAASLNRMVRKLGGLVCTLVGSVLTTIVGFIIHYFVGTKP